jgi:hypothetical protein
MKQSIIFLAILVSTISTKAQQQQKSQITQQLPTANCWKVSSSIVTPGNATLQVPADTINHVAARFTVLDDSTVTMSVIIFHSITGIKGYAYNQLFFKLGKKPFRNLIPSESEKIAAVENKTKLNIIN